MNWLGFKEYKLVVQAHASALMKGVLVESQLTKLKNSKHGVKLTWRSNSTFEIEYTSLVI